MVSGCPGTGSLDWQQGFREVWHAAAHAAAVVVPLPPDVWLTQHHLPLLAALIPLSLLQLVPLPSAVQHRFLRRLHLGLAAHLAERLRRRQAIIATASAASAPLPDSTEEAPSLLRPCPLPVERQLMPADLRRLEVQRRDALGTASSPSSGSAALPVVSAAPPSGEPCRRWLRVRLERLLNEDTVPCPQATAASALEMLCLFETVTN
jgi:hypothetical protein